jgi:hypothetical protein
MSGAMPPLRNVPSWCEQRRLHVSLCCTGRNECWASRLAGKRRCAVWCVPCRTRMKHWKYITRMYHSSSEMWLICRTVGCLMQVVQEFRKINYHNQENCWPAILEDGVKVFMEIYDFICRDHQHDIHFSFISSHSLWNKMLKSGIYSSNKQS